MRSRIATGALLIGVILSTVPVTPALQPQKADAIVSVLDKLHIGFTLEQLGQQLLEWAETFVLSSLKQSLIDALTDQVLGWVQGGGDPKFVLNWKSFLQAAGNNVAASLIDSIDETFLCKPFRFDIKFKLGGIYLPGFKLPTFPTGGKRSRTDCTLDKILGNLSIDSYYEDFRNGGWDAFVESLEPQNNYFGVMGISQHLIEVKREEKSQTDLFKALSGDGFIGTEKCARKDSEGNCVDEITITTPGIAVSGLIGESLKSQFEFIYAADQLADLVGAVLNMALNRLVGAGEEGLLGVDTPKAPGGGTFTGGGGCDDLPAGDLRDDCNDYQGQYGEHFDRAIEDVLGEINYAVETRTSAIAIYEILVGPGPLYLTGEILGFTDGVVPSGIRTTLTNLDDSPRDNQIDSPWDQNCDVDVDGVFGVDDELEAGIRGSMASNITRELTDADTLRADIIRILIDNQTVIDRLTAGRKGFEDLLSTSDLDGDGKTNINDPDSGYPDWGEFTRLRNNFDSDFNRFAADAVLGDANLKVDTFRTDSRDFIQELNKRLRECERVVI